MAVTVMLQREPGYDAENNDWFWAKYALDGPASLRGGGGAVPWQVQSA